MCILTNLQVNNKVTGLSKSKLYINMLLQISKIKLQIMSFKCNSIDHS